MRKKFCVIFVQCFYKHTEAEVCCIFLDKKCRFIKNKLLYYIHQYRSENKKVLQKMHSESCTMYIVSIIILNIFAKTRCSIQRQLHNLKPHNSNNSEIRTNTTNPRLEPVPFFTKNSKTSITPTNSLSSGVTTVCKFVYQLLV